MIVENEMADIKSQGTSARSNQPRPLETAAGAWAEALTPHD
jgi:hypothetical protein